MNGPDSTAISLLLGIAIGMLAYRLGGWWIVGASLAYVTAVAWVTR